MQSGDFQTLIIGYVLYSFCFLLIGIRLTARWTRNQQWGADDYWMWAAAVILVLRVVASHMVLYYGTNNLETLVGLSDYEVDQREFGSKMALVARGCYATL